MTPRRWIHLHATHVSAWEDSHDFDRVAEDFTRVRSRLRDHHGWSLRGHDPYGIWERDGGRKGREHAHRTHCRGEKRVAGGGTIYLQGETSGRTLHFEFWADTSSLPGAHERGPEHEFDKLRRAELLSPVYRLAILVEMAAVVRKLGELGYPLRVNHPDRKYLVDLDEAHLAFAIGAFLRPAFPATPLEALNWSWGEMRFRRDALGGIDASESNAWAFPYPNGTRGCFYDQNHRLAVSDVWRGANSEYWVRHADGTCGAHHLLALYPEAAAARLPRRDPFRFAPRLRQELAKATKKGNWKRVAAIGNVLAREGVPAETP